MPKDVKIKISIQGNGEKEVKKLNKGLKSTVATSSAAAFESMPLRHSSK